MKLFKRTISIASGISVAMVAILAINTSEVNGYIIVGLAIIMAVNIGIGMADQDNNG